MKLKKQIKILVHNKDQNKFSKITTQNDNEGIIQALLDGFKPKDEEPLVLEKVISLLKAYLFYAQTISRLLQVRKILSFSTR